MAGVWRAGALALCVMGLAAPARGQIIEPPPPPPIAAPGGAAPIAFGRPVETVDGALILREAAFALGPITLRAPRVEIYGSTLSAGDIASLLAPGGDPVAQVAAFNAQRVAIPSVEVITLAGGVSQTATYRDMRLEDVANGRIGTMSAASAEIEGTNEAGAPLSGVMTRFTSEGVDIAAGVRLFLGPAAPGAARLTDRFAVEAYAITTDDVRVDMRDLTGAGYRFAPMSRPLGAVLAELTSISKDSNRRDVGAAMDVVGELLAAIEIDSVRLSVMEITSTDRKTMARLNGVWLRDLRGGRLSFGVEAMRFGGAESNATVSGFEIVDYEQSGLFDALARATRESKSVNDLNPAALIPTFRRIALGSVLACKPARADCASGDADFALDEAALERAPMADGLDWRFAIKRFRTPASGQAPASGGSASSLIEWRPQARMLSLREATMTLDGYGEARVGLDLQNVLPQIFTEWRTGALLALIPIAVSRVTVRLVDAGGVDKIAAQQAKAAKAFEKPKGKPAARRSPREMLVRRVARDITALGAAPAVNALKEAVVAFLRNSREPLALTLIANPTIGGADFLGLKDVRRLWGRVSVTSERR